MTKNSDIAWSYFELLGEGRLDEAFEILDDRGGFWGVRTRETTPTPVMKESVRKLWKKMPMTFTLHNALDAGDFGILELESFAALPNGDVYNNRYCYLLKIADGKIMEVREYPDTITVQKMIDTIGWP
jgi:ketosteroid isomerase-like protein